MARMFAVITNNKHTQQQTMRGDHGWPSVPSLTLRTGGLRMHPAGPSEGPGLEVPPVTAVPLTILAMLDPFAPSWPDLGWP
jgi:hypothetical protein